jgi:hypothetical protein
MQIIVCRQFENVLLDWQDACLLAAPCLKQTWLMFPNLVCKFMDLNSDKSECNI